LLRLGGERRREGTDYRSEKRSPSGTRSHGFPPASFRASAVAVDAALILSFATR
jgi:hypothetical protein